MPSVSQSQLQPLHSTAGIGTQDRVLAEQRRKQVISKKSDDSVAIYVNGIPTDGSMTQDTLRELFRHFGTLRKVHLYVNKQTGELKGDALIIYQLHGQDQQRQELLDTVCSQVRVRS